MTDEKVLKRLEAGLKSAQAVEDLCTRIQRLIRIAQRFEDIKVNHQAEEIRRQALELTQNLSDSYEKIDILQKLGCFEEAKQIKKSINGGEDENSLNLISDPTKRKEQEMMLWQQQVSAAEAIEDVEERDRTLADIATKSISVLWCYNIGLNIFQKDNSIVTSLPNQRSKQEISEIYNRALQVAQKIAKVPSRNAALYSIASSLACLLPDIDWAVEIINKNSIIPPSNSDISKDCYRTLAALGEEPLSIWTKHEQIPTAYRFIYMPSFHPSLIIRVWLTKLSAPCLHVVAKRGIKGSAEEHWILTEEKSLALLTAINENQFWHSITWDFCRGFDGATWGFQGWHEGKYKLLIAWSPDHGPAYRLGKFFFDLLPQNLLETIKNY